MVRCISKPDILLNALIKCLNVDTGSYVSLMRESVFKRCFNTEMRSINEDINLNGVNNSKINVLEELKDKILLNNLFETLYPIKFLIVNDDTMKYDLLLGRQFFANASIKLIYVNGQYQFEPADSQMEDSNLIFSIDVVEESDKYDDILVNHDEHLSGQSKNKLLNLFKEVDNLQIDVIEDNYSAKVYLKNYSLFRYAPNRMSINEKNEMNIII